MRNQLKHKSLDSNEYFWAFSKYQNDCFANTSCKIHVSEIHVYNVSKYISININVYITNIWYINE